MEQEQPLVTVYIPCRNYGHFLNQAAESVINQVYKNWELIITDEGPKDDTSNIAEKILKRKPEQITFIKNQPIQISSTLLRKKKTN